MSRQLQGGAQPHAHMPPLPCPSHHNVWPGAELVRFEALQGSFNDGAMGSQQRGRRPALLIRLSSLGRQAGAAAPLRAGSARAPQLHAAPGSPRLQHVSVNGGQRCRVVSKGDVDARRAAVGAALRQGRQEAAQRAVVLLRLAARSVLARGRVQGEDG